MSNRQLDDMYEEQGNMHVATLLGLTPEEYAECEHDSLKTQETEDGLVTAYYIEFKETTPEEILKKIKGIDSTGTVYFEPSDFDSAGDFTD